VDIPLLEIRDLVKVRRQGGVSFELVVPGFEIQDGSFISLVGESGCGKSTLLDVIALVLQPDACGLFQFQNPAGRSAWAVDDVKALWESDDEQALAALRRERLGYVLQSGGLLPFLTARQNLQLPLLINGKQDQFEIVERFAKKMGIANLLSKKPRYLSGGQRQRVAILRAMVHQPALILADEPTAAVDRARARAIINDLSTLAREGGSSVVMVTHDPKLVEPVADASWVFQVAQLSATSTRSVCVEQA
jgi:putative ABC transport system ATP-binding protein